MTCQPQAGRWTRAAAGPRRLFASRPNQLDLWSQAVVVRTRTRVAAPVIRELVTELLRCHPALRFRFQREASGWIRHVAPLEPCVSLSLEFAGGDGTPADWREAIARARRALNVAQGLVFKFLVLDDVWSRRFERYADLQHQWDQETVALFVAPIRTGRS